ncbi:MAG: hypothetical protein AB7P14_09415 [Blastocatellales bacterium]
MFKQKRKNRRRWSFATTISAVVSGMALLFLFNHQALAIIICCASEQIQTTPSCHQQMEDGSDDQNTGSGSHHRASQTEEKESVATRAAEWSRPLPQCCRTTAPIESEPPLASVSKEVSSGVVAAFAPLAVSTVEQPITTYSLVYHGSPPVYLLTSRLII